MILKTETEMNRDRYNNDSLENNTTGQIPVRSMKVPIMNRPPKPPGPALGPYYHFISTDLNKMLWLGSALILRHVSFPRPKVQFLSKPKVDCVWNTLYDNLFDMCVYRLDISIELLNGEADDEIKWIIDWNDHVTEGHFYIARYKQKWRGGFFSCNGFDATVPEEAKAKLIFGNVWEHLNLVHAETPLHLLIWGGDQTYIDFIFQDIPFLIHWIDFDWDVKWITEFNDDLRCQVEQYHFNAYAENWERPEVKNALASIPSLMMWDDHDIFDGAGSYPPLLHDSPMMLGLFKTAQKMRLLFQHHTTIEKARQHGLFGYKSYNSFAYCGPNLAIVCADGRSERDIETVQHETSWNMIFDYLENNIVNIPHLIVVFPVPFSFLRFKLAESIFEYIKNLPNKCRSLPIVKNTNSIFGLPELYDDLLDEWTHDAHIDERNRALERFQDFAKKKRVRVTFFSGDVHCCGVARFKTRNGDSIAPNQDPKLMYQIISSAIVNLPPPRSAIRIAHLGETKWYPIENTEEQLINFFQHAPESGRKLFFKKLLSNRNWCYFEQCDEISANRYTPIKTGFFHRIFASKSGNSTPRSNEHQNDMTNIGQHNRAYSSAESNNGGQMHTQINTLKIRLWLESERNHKPGRDFVKYDLLIPNLL